jgi:hypothetical protein
MRACGATSMSAAIEVRAWKVLGFWWAFAARGAASSSTCARPSIAVRSTGARAANGTRAVRRTPAIRRARKDDSIIATRCETIENEGGRLPWR